jgi:putative serine protease PepD
MTETPNGPQDPQQSDTSSSPQPGRPPYAGSEWRRADAPTAPPVSAPGTPSGEHQVGSQFAGTQRDGEPQVGSSPFGAPRDGEQQAGSSQFGAPQGGTGYGYAQTPQGAPQYGSPQGNDTDRINTHYAPQYQYGATRYGQQPTGSPWPYAAPAEAKRARGSKRLVAVAAITAVVGGLVGGGAVALADRNDNPAVSAGGITIQGSSAPTAATQTGTVEAAASTAMKSVVTLSVRGSQEAGTGSGIVLRSDGYILTNEHVTAVADGGGSITVAFADGRTATATLVGADKATDLAVVKVNLTGLTAATFADSDALKVGQTVVAVGSPLGLNGTVTEGIVSALHRPTTGASDNSAVIDAVQTDAAINPGNSGGALVDLAGRVVGINQSIATASSGGGFGQQGSASGNIGIGFAIPSDTAARISQQLIATGKATHALLGVQTQTATSSDQLTAIGATISQVTPGSAAAAAGIKAGDVVIKVDNRVIGQSDDLAATVRSYAPGTKVTLTLKRGNATQTVTVTLGSDAK